jgi:uncharacterized membrane protein
MKLFKFLCTILVLAIITGCGKKAEIAGSVLDDLGNPVEGAVVKITNTAFTSATDKKGAYSINYVPGTVRMVVSKPGYASSAKEFNIAIETRFPAETVVLEHNPSSADIEQAMREGVPKLVLLQNVVVDKITIIAVGEAQEIDGIKCWPVKAHVKFHGSDLGFGRTSSESDFPEYIHRNQQGRWSI